MVANTIPEGCLNTKEAYEYYLERRLSLGGMLGTEEQQSMIQGELISAFADRSIEALVRRSASESIEILPAESWSKEDWPERLFLSPQIQSGSAWGPLSGNVVFVRKEQFENWANQQLAVAPSPSGAPTFDGALIDQDPMQMPLWSLGMAMMWVAYRSPDKMRSLSSTRFVAELFDSQFNSRLELIEAKRKLLNALASGAIAATGRPAVGRRREIVEHEWADLKLHHEVTEDDLTHWAWGQERDDTGRPRDASYRDIRLKREHVVSSEWQPGSDVDASSSPSAALPRSGAPGRPSSMNFIEQEFHRRISAGEAAQSNTAEAKYLAGWLKNTHPNMPSAGEKAIRNKLGNLRRGTSGQTA